MNTYQRALAAACWLGAAGLAFGESLDRASLGIADFAAVPSARSFRAATDMINNLTTTPALAFPVTLPGSTSKPMNVLAAASASNTGNVTITLCTIGGAHPGDFAQTPAVANLSVAPGASVFIPVRFSPTVGEARTAILTCSMSNAQSPTFDVVLTGSGTSQPPTTTRVSLSSGGDEGNRHSYVSSVSADGRYIAFTSLASNLVPDDINESNDVFVHDRQTEQTQRVSVATSGAAGFGPSFDGSLSANGRFVAFVSSVNTLVSGDTNNLDDVFVHDRQTGETQRVSVASGGVQTNGPSFRSAISADGRFVAFSSAASNLVPGDTNSANDVFVHDRQTGLTQRVNVTSTGNQALGSSFRFALSSDGRYVSFDSQASNLVLNDTNGVTDVFVHDRQTGQTQRVSVSSDGGQANGASDLPAISADGRHVAFASLAGNLVSGDFNAMRDVFVHDRFTGQTQRVSIATAGSQANGFSDFPSLSADGRSVAFVSQASNLVPGDTNGVTDVFLHDRQSGETERVSVSTGGGEGDNTSDFGTLSANGRHVAFQSSASNLVPADTNSMFDVFVRDRGVQDLLFGDGFQP